MQDVNYNLITESVYGNHFLFQGREYDYDTTLYYFRVRWYEPETGRWLSPDPIGISGGLNLYTFCGNDPVNHTDPMGKDFPVWTGLGSSIGGDFRDHSGKNPTKADLVLIEVPKVLATGAAHAIDGFIPKANPLYELGVYSKNDKYSWFRAGGRGVRAAAITYVLVHIPIFNNPYIAASISGISSFLEKDDFFEDKKGQ